MRKLPFTVIYLNDKNRLKKKRVMSYCAEDAFQELEDRGYKVIEAGLGKLNLTTSQLNDPNICKVMELKNDK